MILFHRPCIPSALPMAGHCIGLNDRSGRCDNVTTLDAPACVSSVSYITSPCFRARSSAEEASVASNNPRDRGDLAQGPISWAREIFERKNLSYLDEALADNFVNRTPQGKEPPGRESYKAFMTFLLQGYPDANVNVEDVIVDGEKVVARWTFRGTNHGRAFNMQPTGKSVEFTGVNISRVDANGRIAEIWTYVDTTTMLRQLGTPQLPQALIPSLDEIRTAVGSINPT
jgi:steroid delta-isomerase-like uncharacterized protein